jgi:RNA polymerase sigma-70 factor, ECF subfamily
MVTSTSQVMSVAEERPFEPVAELSPAFRHVFDAEFTHVCRTLRRLGVRQADLKDVAQELFLTVHQRFGEYDPARPLRPWLFSFALRLAANYRRLSRNRGHVSDVVLAEHTSGPPEAEARDLVLGALGELDFDRRVALVMHDLEGFAAPEIAEHLGLNVNTVYSRIRLARDDFRSAVARLQSKGGAS